MINRISPSRTRPKPQGAACGPCLTAIASRRGNGYASNIWMTYRQAQEFKAQVRKGEHGSLVVFADRFKKTETNNQGQDVEKEIPFMKGYMGFNVEQIEGLLGIYNVNPKALAEKFLLIENAEKSINATGATVRHGGDKAYYSSSPDVIQLPCPEAFKDAESCAATKPP